MRRMTAVLLAWSGLIALAGAAGAQPVEGTYALRDRDGTDVGQLEVDRSSTGRLRLTRDGDEVWVAEDAVLAGRTIYALYKSEGAGMAGALQGRSGSERLLGVYRLSSDLRGVEERVTRAQEGAGDERLVAHSRGVRVATGGQGGPARTRAPRAKRPSPPVDVDGVVGRLQKLLGGPEVARDLAALHQRDVELSLTATRLGPVGLDQALTLLSSDSRTRLARQELDSSAALELFRLGALRNPPAQRAGVRGLSSLLQQEVVPQQFARAHLLLGQGRLPSTRFSEPDQVETWVLLAETREGEMVAVRAEWRTPAKGAQE